MREIQTRKTRNTNTFYAALSIKKGFYYTAQKMKFSNKHFSSKCDQICSSLQICRKLVPFTEEILNGKLHFLYGVS